MKLFKGLTFASGLSVDNTRINKVSQFTVPNKTKLTCDKYKVLFSMFGYTLAVKLK